MAVPTASTFTSFGGLCEKRFAPAASSGRLIPSVISLLGLGPEDVMMVAAHNYDLVAARAEGMATAFVPRPLEFGSGQRTDLKAESGWDIIAENFEDLAARLNC